ncbi:MAG: response regulator transcription factor [Nitrospira sp.]|nr:response regulator transcription factor [Nitrospira sp.]
MAKAHIQGSLRTVVIISAQYVVWLDLKNILESSKTLRVIGEPVQREGNQTLLTQYRPDVVILDTETERDATGTIQQIQECSPTSKIIVWSGFEDKDRLREAVEYGVDGVILKIHPPAVVLATIESLYPSPNNTPSMGDNVRRPLDLEEHILERYDSMQQATPWPDALTEREREIIQLVGQGMSNKDIAYRLSIADSTVRHHLTSIFDKVGVPNRQKLLLHTHHFRLPPV